MRYAPIQIVTAASMAADITSAIIPIDQVFGYAIQAVYTTSGSLGGVLALQASVDHQQDLNGNVTRAGNFTTITDSPVTLTGAGNYVWNVTSGMYLYVKLIYTHTGGDAGTLNAYALTKGF